MTIQLKTTPHELARWSFSATAEQEGQTARLPVSVMLMLLADAKAAHELHAMVYKTEPVGAHCVGGQDSIETSEREAL